MKNITLLILCFSLSGVAFAEMYKWVDENGKIHYTDKDPALDNKNPVATEVIQPNESNVFSSEEAKIIPKDPPPPKPSSSTKQKPSSSTKDDDTYPIEEQ